MLISPGVLIDGEEKFLMQNSAYSFFYLNPGLHTFTLKLSDRYEGLAQVQLNTQLHTRRELKSKRLKTDTKDARLKSSLIQHGLAAWRLGRKE